MSEEPRIAALEAEVKALRGRLAERQGEQAEAERTRAALLSLLEDVRESNERLEQARREWEQSFDAVTAPLIVHGRGGHILRANRAYARCAGLEVETLTGRLHHETWPRPEEVVRLTELGESSREVVLGDGRIFLQHGYPAGTRGAEGWFCVHLFEDVTAERRAGEHLLASLEATIGVLAKVVAVRDPYTAGHDRRVADLAASMAAALGLDEEAVTGVRLGALVHDLGKVALPAELLAKPAQLTATERALIQTHAAVGHAVLAEVEFPWPIAECALMHHERLDGSGYPQGLAGEAIPVHARIIAVADVVEAMASHRPYRPARGIEAALAEIEGGSGRRYCPRATAACLTLFRDGGYRFPD